ncbi:MAG: hypothetical protein HY877_05925 [Deltaproteobacteria bacterium]|nr:hypothetical protein [Deltaproteobacteria bacterium]
MFYLITSCLRTECGTTPCRIDPKYFRNTSCPYADDYIDIPTFLKAFSHEIEKYGGDIDVMEPHMQEETNIPLCIIAPEILRNAALGCEGAVAKN